MLYSVVCLANDDTKVQAGTGFKYTINNTRNFVVDDNTVLKLDGQIVPFTRVQAGAGFKTRYSVHGNTNEILGGTIDEINLINTHKGPITSLDPLKIFNVDVLVTSNTFIDDNLVLGNVIVGDELKISGFIDDNSNLQASRIEKDNDPLSEWKISGTVSLLTLSQFNLGNQVVIIGGLIDNCTGGLVNGDFVEVKSTPDVNFVLGSQLTGVTKIDCVVNGVDIPPNGVVPIALEGFIDALGVNGNFSIGEHDVVVSASTTYINGDIDDIQLSVKVEVEGLLNTVTNEIQAVKVKFREVRFKFEAPVNPADIIAGESITIMGQTIISTPQLRDEDGYFNGGIAGIAQIEVRGFTRFCRCSLCKLPRPVKKPIFNKENWLLLC